MNLGLMKLNLMLWVVMLAAYFLPTILAYCDKKRNVTAIFVLNLFTGWTGIGWIACLVWSCVKEK